MKTFNIEEYRAKVDKTLEANRIKGQVDWANAPTNAKIAVYHPEKDFHLFGCKDAARSGMCWRFTLCSGEIIYLNRESFIASYPSNKGKDK